MVNQINNIKTKQRFAGGFRKMTIPQLLILLVEYKKMFKTYIYLIPSNAKSCVITDRKAKMYI
jgi:hypothetical protein